MGSDFVSEGTVAVSRDIAKKKKTHRSARLKQCKLDARREQWLSQGRISIHGAILREVSPNTMWCISYSWSSIMPFCFGLVKCASVIHCDISQQDNRLAKSILNKHSRLAKILHLHKKIFYVCLVSYLAASYETYRDI